MRKSVRSLRYVKQWKPSTLLQKLLLNKEYILPKPFDPRIKDTVSAAVFKAALESGVARVKFTNNNLIKVQVRKTKEMIRLFK